jgi:hypothetical protein
MNRGFRVVSAFVAASILSLATTPSVLAASQSATLTIRITRPTAATVTIVSYAGMPTAVSGSLSPGGAGGSASLCYASAAGLSMSTDCTSGTSDTVVAVALPVDDRTADLDVVASAT